MKRRLFSLSLILIVTIFLNYFLLLNEKEAMLDVNVRKIDEILSKNFAHGNRLLKFVGKRISEENPDLDLKKIHQIFLEVSQIRKVKNTFSWSLFDWVDVNGYQAINTALGIRKDPPRMLERNYRNRSNENWQMIFSQVVIGDPSQMEVLPIGMQIDTKKIQYAGTIALGISVDELKALISDFLSDNLEYAIIDSRDNQFSFGSSKAKERFEDISFSKLETSDMGKLFAYKKMNENYPYKIVISYNKSAFYRELTHNVAIMFSQILFTVLLLFCWLRPKECVNLPSVSDLKKS